MKTKWITPKTEIETFAPNEYIAVCWGVGCSVDAANSYERRNGPSRWESWWDLGCTHDAAHCGASGNQVIQDYNNDGIADKMIETGTDGLGDLSCTIYTDATYRTIRDVSSVKVNNYIYWTTSAADGRVWHHQGLVTGTVAGRPNAS